MRTTKFALFQALSGCWFMMASFFLMGMYQREDTTNDFRSNNIPFNVESYHCFFRAYAPVEHHSGLPFVGDVFASQDRQSIYIVAENRGACRIEWEESQEFHSSKRTGRRQFICTFTDGSAVLSDPVHRKSGGDNRWSNTVMLIRCPIPSQLRDSVPEPGARLTTFSVSLHATQDLEANSTASTLGKPFQRFNNLPVCSYAWPSTISPGETRKPRKYVLSLTTRLASSFIVNQVGNSKASELTREGLVSWIEYHLAIGIEHFYIYDGSIKPKGPVYTWLFPYMEKEVVTYIYYPYKDCKRDYLPGQTQKKKFKPYHYTGQYISTNSALRRYSGETKWMGHWDVDEFLIIPQFQGASSLKNLLNNADAKIDNFIISRQIFTVCQGDKILKSMMAIERQQCAGEEDERGKGLYRADTTLYFSVHNSVATVNNTDPKQVNLEKSKIYLGHYRQRPSNPYDLPEFEGTAHNSQWSNRLHPLQNWTDFLREQVDKHAILVYTTPSTG